MSTNKYIILCIIFLMAMPCKIIFAQDMESDTAVQSELDIKYDLVLAKATASLTASAYQQSIDYYRAASVLKPSETYPYKMINYVEDLAAKQKRADDLKRKAQIKDDLTKANQAIVNRDWNTAKIIFNQILTLHPDKTDEDYARSKVQAIDLELQRIALRVPVKEEPKPVVVPKNRREARAFRKLEERNAMLAAKNNKTQQQPVQSASPAKNVTVSADAVKKMPQNPIQKPSPAGNVTVSPPVNKAIQQKPALAPPTSKNVAIAVDSAKKTQQKTIQASSPSVNGAVTSPVVKETQQKPAEALAQATSPSIAPPVTKSVALPAAKEIPQKPVQTLSPGSMPVAQPSDRETAAQKQATSSPAKSVAATLPSNNEIQQKPLPTTPAKTNPTLTNQETQQKPKETPALVKNEPVAAPSITELPKPADASQLKLSDSSDYIKFTCQDISFIGSNAYIKVLIQNSNPGAEFQTDTLHVSIVKNNGIIKKLNQRFISNFPVVMPLKELVLVSLSDAATGIEPDDIFIIEMRDRMRKTKLTVQVPWSLYTQSKNF